MAPHVSLGLPSDNDPLKYAATCNGALRAQWARTRPDLVMVQGDTASAYAGAQAAAALEIPIAHVEAGVRTGDYQDPWPEEAFRDEIDQIATLLFAPTAHTMRNLMNTDGPATGKLEDAPKWARARWTDAWEVGNSGIDALYAHTQPTTEVQDRVLVTLHRRESFGGPLRHLVAGITKGAQRTPDLEFVWPTHPNPHVQEALPKTGWQNLVFMAPLGSALFADLLSTSRAVITDSGGVQEEAAALGIPCIVAREKTDRPESVEAGLAKVVGRTEQGILDGLDWALGFTTRPDPSHCFGDGHAAPRIVDHLLG